MADDGDVLAVLLEPGSRFRFHEHPFGPHPWSAHDAWGETTVLQLHREGDAYGVWKFFEGGVFTRWYVNFEAPVVRHDGRVRHRRPRARPDRAPRRTSGVEGREDLSELVTSGRMTGEEVVGVLHAAAEVSARLDRDERWWAPWDHWAPPNG